MPAHNPNMSSTLTIMTLLQQIENTFQMIPKLLQHLLMSDNPNYQASTSAIRSPAGTCLILNSLLHTCHSTVTEWVIEVAQEIFRNEIIKASEVEMGLHLNVSQACSANLMGFEYAAPLTWGVIHTLLDVKSITQFHRKKNLQQAVSYDSHHMEGIDDILVNKIGGDM